MSSRTAKPKKELVFYYKCFFKFFFFTLLSKYLTDFLTQQYCQVDFVQNVSKRDFSPFIPGVLSGVIGHQIYIVKSPVFCHQSGNFQKK